MSAIAVAGWLVAGASRRAWSAAAPALERAKPVALDRMHAAGVVREGGTF